MNIFVTGAAGFVGSHLLPILSAKGYRVTALVRTDDEKRRIISKAKIVIGDLAKQGSWQKELIGQDIIVHLAAQISAKDPKVFKKNNVEATKNLIEAAKIAKVKKIILFSSAAVTSIRKDAYAKTKEIQESQVANSKINYTILRPSMIYGPGDTKNIGWLIKLISPLPVVPLPGGGHFGRQPVFVEDICKIALKLIENNYPKKVYEIHGREYVSMRQMVKVIAKRLKTPKIVFPIPLIFLKAAFYILEKILPNPKFTSDQIDSLTSGEIFKGDDWWEIFDIMPTSFEAGIDKMITKK